VVVLAGQENTPFDELTRPSHSVSFVFEEAGTPEGYDGFLSYLFVLFACDSRNSRLLELLILPG
jgi:hypothetical protein